MIEICMLESESPEAYRRRTFFKANHDTFMSTSAISDLRNMRSAQIEGWRWKSHSSTPTRRIRFEGELIRVEAKVLWAHLLTGVIAFDFLRRSVKRQQHQLEPRFQSRRPQWVDSNNE